MYKKIINKEISLFVSTFHNGQRQNEINVAIFVDKLHIVYNVVEILE